MELDIFMNHSIAFEYDEMCRCYILPSGEKIDHLTWIRIVEPEINCAEKNIKNLRMNYPDCPDSPEGPIFDGSYNKEYIRLRDEYERRLQEYERQISSIASSIDYYQRRLNAIYAGRFTIWNGGIEILSKNADTRVHSSGIK